MGSLFAGIGGIDLGLEWAGFQTQWFCEQDEYCQKILAKHWPGVPCFPDVRGIDENAARVDVLAGGFPCQPVSTAGRRLAQDDPRWLWPEFARLICLLRPRGVLLENVPGLFTAGFGDVLGDLAESGYDAEWDCIPAAAAGAPHLRDRVFIIASPRAELRRNLADSDNTGPRDAIRARGYAAGDGSALVADSDFERLHGRAGGKKGRGQQSEDRGEIVADSNCERLERTNWQIQLEQRPGRGDNGGAPMADTSGAGRQGQGESLHSSDSEARREREATEPLNGGVKGIWATEPAVGRVANGIPNRVDRLRALGNAVVPQVAEIVGRRLMEVISD